MTRRELLWCALGAQAAAAAGKPPSLMSVEGYIFQQYAQRLGKPLIDVMPDVLQMAKRADFRNIELSPAFFPAATRDTTFSLIRSEGLALPSLYVGGVLHEREAARATIATALTYGGLCAPFGCKAIVTNPDPKHGEAPKTDAELAVQAGFLNQMGRELAQNGLELRVHHHTPQLVQNAREWRYILAHTDPALVHLCVDVDWAYEGGFEAVPFLQEAGTRLKEIHIRSARNKVWLEDLEDSDIDYHQVAGYLKRSGLRPLIVVELAYRVNTVITRTLAEDLRLSRIYAGEVFGVSSGES